VQQRQVGFVSDRDRQRVGERDFTRLGKIGRVQDRVGAAAVKKTSVISLVRAFGIGELFEA
jgi:hypothetical protein